jgi:TetR/AcrR family transcriptional repressor of lmrAB and yxaGH operons
MLNNREKFLKTAGALMEKQGYHGTGLSEILSKSGAPKGSLYYYFPEGKEQIASEVVLQAGNILATRIREKTQDEPDAGKAIHNFLCSVAQRMEETDYHSGSPLTMLAMESVTQSERVNQACREAYDMLVDTFKEILVTKGGMEEVSASSTAEMIVSAVEGSIVLSRTHHSADYLRRVADHIEKMLSL